MLPRAIKTDWRILIAALLYLGAGLAVTAHFATWNDEEYTLATTAHGVSYAFARAINYELQAPLYFGIVAAWRELDMSVWFARLFSLLCATGFFVALVKIGRRVVPKVDPLPFAVVVALNPFVAYAAFEIRLYSLALLLSALMWLAFDDGFIEEGASLRSRLWFVALAMFAIYVQYFLGFLLAGFACAVAIARGGRALAVYCAYAVVPVIAAIPLLLLLRGQLSGTVDASLTVARLLRSAAVNTTALVFPFDAAWGVVPNARVLYICMVLATILLFALSKPRLSRRSLAYCGCLVTIAGLYAICAVVLSLDLSARHFVALFVPLAVAGYALYGAVDPSRPYGRLAFLPTIVLTLAVLVWRYRHLAQSEDWMRVAPFLETHVAAGDVIAIYPPDAMPAFQRQYHGSAPYVPWPRPYSTQHYSSTISDVGSEAEARADFAKLAGYRHVWFVNDAECLPSFPQHGCDIVKEVMNDSFNVDMRYDFYRATVLELSGFRSGEAQS